MDWMVRGIVLIWLAVCAIYDLRRAAVPNWLTIPMMVLGGILACWLGGDRLLFLLIAALVFIPVWKIGSMGGGDVKVFVGLAGLWPSAFLASLVFSLVWVVLLKCQKMKKVSYLGIPPAAVGGLLTLGLEGAKYWIKVKQGG